MSFHIYHRYICQSYSTHRVISGLWLYSLCNHKPYIEPIDDGWELHIWKHHQGNHKQMRIFHKYTIQGLTKLSHVAMMVTETQHGSWETSVGPPGIHWWNGIDGLGWRWIFLRHHLANRVKIENCCGGFQCGWVIFLWYQGRLKLVTWTEQKWKLPSFADPSVSLSFSVVGKFSLRLSNHVRIITRLLKADVLVGMVGTFGFLAEMVKMEQATVLAQSHSSCGGGSWSRQP